MTFFEWHDWLIEDGAWKKIFGKQKGWEWRVQEVHKAFDEDKSGCLNIEEFTALVEWRFEKPKITQPNDSPCGDHFEESDLDKNKVLEAEEIVKLMEKFTQNSEEEFTSELGKQLAL